MKIKPLNRKKKKVKFSFTTMGEIEEKDKKMGRLAQLSKHNRRARRLSGGYFYE